MVAVTWLGRRPMKHGKGPDDQVEQFHQFCAAMEEVSGSGPGGFRGERNERSERRSTTGSVG